MRRPLVFPLLAITGGILIGERIFIPAVYLLGAMASVLILVLLVVRSQCYRAALALILLFVCLVGMFGIQRHTYETGDHRHILHRADQGILTVEGVVLKTQPVSESHHGALISCRRTINNNSYTPVTGNLRLTFPAHLHFEYGDFIRFHTKIKKIHNFIHSDYSCSCFYL